MKVSVIIVCRNSAKTIRVTLDSILCQTHHDIETVVVDGASTDGTQDIIKSYGAKIAKFISEKDEGSSDAANKGVQLAGGEVLSFLGSDDTFADPHVVEKIVRLFEEDANVDYVGGAIQWIIPENGKKWKVCYSRPDSMLYGCKAFIPGSFFRKRVIRDTPFTNEIEYANDYDLLCDVLVGQKSKYKVLPEIVVYFMLGGRSNWSRNRVTGKIDMFRVRKKYFGLLAALFFAVPDFSVAYAQRLGFRPLTWWRKLTRFGQHG